MNESNFDEIVVGRELENFQRNFQLAQYVFEKVDTCLLCLGVLGNIAAIITMMKSRPMRTPSFVYHKVLVVADLLFCINFLLMKFVDQTQTVNRNGRQFYSNPIVAFYLSVLNRAITSTCGYVALYMSISIGVDRFIALWVISVYDKFNKHFVARSIVVTCTVLSAVLHSWSTWLERKIIGVDFTVSSSTDLNITTRLYFSQAVKDSSLMEGIVVKDIYNMAVRVSYPITLTFLTGLVIWGFNVQQRKKRTMVATNKRQTKNERCLFYLMIAVVSLACIQVIPRESKRLLDLLCPSETAVKNMVDTKLDLSIRLKYFYVFSYGHEFSRIVLNTVTAVDRSLIFYLYFALNHSFRKEVVRVFKLRRLAIAIRGKFRWTYFSRSKCSERTPLSPMRERGLSFSPKHGSEVSNSGF